MKFLKILFVMLFISVGSFANDINIDKLSKMAQKENKQLLLFFHMTYCPYCEKMTDENFNNKEFLQEFNKKFIFVDININEDGNIHYKDFNGDKSDFADKYSIQFFPTLKFIDNGKIVYSVKGYRNKDKFQNILKYLATKSYKRIDLAEFIDELEMAED